MSVKTKPNKPFHGQDKRMCKDTFFTYEIWENFIPDKLAGGEKTKYFPGILSEDQLKVLIPFWRELGKELIDPILSLQIDKNGGTTILYQYSDERDGVPPNARYWIVKPIMERGILKMILEDSTKSTFVLHTSINSPSFEDDIRDFLTIIENNVVDEDKLKERGVQIELFSHTFVFDRRANKSK